MPPKVLCAVVTADNDDVSVFVSLLAGHLTDKLDFIYYAWPSRMDPKREFDLVILHDYNLIAEIAERYPVKTPTIVHLDPQPMRDDYYQPFPDHKVVRIKQATLDRLDYTLQLAAFEGVVLNLYEHK